MATAGQITAAAVQAGAVHPTGPRRGVRQRWWGRSLLSPRRSRPRVSPASPPHPPTVRPQGARLRRRRPRVSSCTDRSGLTMTVGKAGPRCGGYCWVTHVFRDATHDMASHAVPCRAAPTPPPHLLPGRAPPPRRTSPAQDFTRGFTVSKASVPGARLYLDSYASATLDGSPDETVVGFVLSMADQVKFSEKLVSRRRRGWHSADHHFRGGVGRRRVGDGTALTASPWGSQEATFRGWHSADRHFRLTVGESGGDVSGMAHY